MNSVTTLRRPNSSKSRIPVAVKIQKSTNVKNIEKKFKNPVSKVQASHSYKITDHCLLPDKKQYVKSTKDSKFKKNIQSSFRTNEKSNNNKKDGKQSLLKCNIKSGSTNVKGLSESTSVKSSSIRVKDSSSLKVHIKSDDRTEKHLLLKTNANYCRSKQNNLVSLKTNLQSGDNKKEKLSTLKTAVKPDDNSPQKLATPKSISEKENKVSSKPSWFTAQKGIKFEANEIFRKMILRERELSPSVCNLMPSLRLSSIQSQRPSIYQSFELPPDPFKEAMQAIQNGLSTKKDKKFEALYKLPASPFRDRGSFYTPCADPKLEVMESLRKLKLKQQQKSSKKVTFDLNIKEWTPKGTCDTELKSFQTSDCKLSQINEKSEENTPNSPQSQVTEVSTAKQDQCNTTVSELKKNDKDFLNYKEVKSTEKVDDTKEEMLCESSAFSTPAIKLLPVTLTKDVTPQEFSPIQSKKFEFNTIKKTDPSSSNFSNDHRQIIEETSIKQRTVNFQTLEPTNINDGKIETTLSKVYTPRPVSLFSQSKLMDSSSPEFLVNRASETFLKLAPIYTPLVLKSVAKSTMLSPVGDLSPVRLKLDFSEKDTPKKEISKIHTLVNCKNITTAQNMLDELADQECCFFLSNDSIPVVCGRYIMNPVALTLSEGDDMHFIPIHF